MKGKGFTDAEIVEALQDASRLDTTVRYLYQTHFESLANFIRTNSGNDQDAEDLFHETLVVFIELVKQQKFRGDSSIKTFLYAIQRNLWLNELKKRSRTSYRETTYYDKSEKYERDIQYGVAQEEARKQVLGLIDKLGENCKKILVLFYYEEMSMKDIFRQMGYENEQVARNMKYKCMKKLNDMLDSDVAVKQLFKNLLVDE